MKTSRDPGSLQRLGRSVRLSDVPGDDDGADDWRQDENCDDKGQIKVRSRGDQVRSGEIRRGQVRSGEIR